MFSIVPDVDTSSILQLDDAGKVTPAPKDTVESEFASNVLRLERKIVEQEHEDGLDMADDEVLSEDIDEDSAEGEHNKRKLDIQTVEWPFAKVAQDVREAAHEALQLLQVADLIHQQKGFELEMVPRQSQKPHTTFFKLQVNVKQKSQQVRDVLDILENGISRVSKAHKRDRKYVSGVAALQLRWRIVAPSHGKLLTYLRAQEPLAIDCGMTTAGLRPAAQLEARLRSAVTRDGKKQSLAEAPSSSQNSYSSSQGSSQSNSVAKRKLMGVAPLESEISEARLFQNDNGDLLVDISDVVPKTILVKVMRNNQTISVASIASHSLRNILAHIQDEGVESLTNNERLQVLSHSSLASEVFERIRIEVAMNDSSLSSYRIIHNMNDRILLQVNASVVLDVSYVLINGDLKKHLAKSSVPTPTEGVALSSALTTCLLAAVRAEMLREGDEYHTEIMRRLADTCRHTFVCAALTKYCYEKLPKIGKSFSGEFSRHCISVKASVQHVKNLAARCRVTIGSGCALEYVVQAGRLQLVAVTGSDFVKQSTTLQDVAVKTTEIEEVLNHVLYNCLCEQVLSEIMHAVAVLGYTSEVDELGKELRIIGVVIPEKILKAFAIGTAGRVDEGTLVFRLPKELMHSLADATLTFESSGEKAEQVLLNWDALPCGRFQDQIIGLITRAQSFES